MSTLLAWTIMNRGKGTTHYCRPSEHRSEGGRQVLSGSYAMALVKLLVQGPRSLALILSLRDRYHH